MAMDISKRLGQLRARRDGSDRWTLDSAVRDEILAKSLLRESWEKRGSEEQPHTRYAIGAMQAVGATYTKVSLETGDRVAKQLNTRLASSGISVEFRLQGSVPLDVHIRRVSDVDLLTLDTSFLTYVSYGPRSQSGGYSSTPKTSKGVLSELRTQVEKSLHAAFPAATVDTTGAKAVKISGGSLPRSVDVVPAHWWDTVAYQTSGEEADRAVTIFNKKTEETIDNFPFLHIARIGNRCDAIGGGLRKAIRLCKNVKADSDRDITLPSFDIAATMYHADMDALRFGKYFDLAVLAETQRFLDVLACDESAAKALYVPDGSRRIFDTPEKISGLRRLSLDMDDLLNNVYRENAPLRLGAAPPLSDMRSTVRLLSV